MYVAGWKRLEPPPIWFKTHQCYFLKKICFYRIRGLDPLNPFEGSMYTLQKPGRGPYKSFKGVYNDDCEVFVNALNCPLMGSLHLQRQMIWYKNHPKVYEMVQDQS